LSSKFIGALLASKKTIVASAATSEESGVVIPSTDIATVLPVLISSPKEIWSFTLDVSHRVPVTVFATLDTSIVTVGAAAVDDQPLGSVTSMLPPNGMVYAGVKVAVDVEVCDGRSIAAVQSPMAADPALSSAANAISRILSQAGILLQPSGAREAPVPTSCQQALSTLLSCFH
jgi:hypothetical protein